MRPQHPSSFQHGCTGNRHVSPQHGGWNTRFRWFPILESNEYCESDVFQVTLKLGKWLRLELHWADAELKEVVINEIADRDLIRSLVPMVKDAIGSSSPFPWLVSRPKQVVSFLGFSSIPYIYRALHTSNVIARYCHSVSAGSQKGVDPVNQRWPC